MTISRPLRALLGVLVAALALLAVGCGGSSGGDGGSPGAGAEGAALAPASSTAFVAFSSDLDSEQWQGLDSLLQRFPARERLLTKLRAELSKRNIDYETDVKPALGPEMDLVVFKANEDPYGYVLLTKPKDEDKFQALVTKLDRDSSDKSVSEKIDGWTVLANDQATIDAFKASRGGDKLAEAGGFKDAMASVSDDALVKAYVDGKQINAALTKKLSLGSNGTKLGRCAADAAQQNQLGPIAMDVRAQSDGLRVDAVLKGASSSLQASKSYQATLADKVPSGALLFLSFSGAGLGQQGAMLEKLSGCDPKLGKQLSTFQQQFLEPIRKLVPGEAALYVLPGSPIPQVTMLAKVDDEAAARGELDNLVGRLSGLAPNLTPTTVTVDGVSLKQVAVGGRFSILYGTFDGMLMVSDSRAVVDQVRGGGSKLSDDEVFKEAKDASQMPDSTNGFLYLNAKDSIPLIESLAELGGQRLPPEVTNNLDPLHSLLAYSTVKGSQVSSTAVLQIK